MIHRHFILLVILNLIIGAYIYLKNPKKQTHISFAILSVTFAFWITTIFLFINSHSYHALLFAGRMAFTVGMIAPAALLNFTLSFPNRRISKKQLFYIYMPGCITSFLSITPLIIRDIKIHDWGVEPVIGAAYPVILLYFLSYILLIIYKIFQKFKNAIGVEKLQLIYIVMGFSLLIFHVLLTNMILPLLGYRNIYLLGPWATVELTFIIGYAIVRYRLLDITIVVKRTTLYLFLIGFITGIYSFILILPRNFFGATENTHSILVTILVSIIIAITIVPLRNWLDNITNKIFFQKQYDYYKVLERTSRELSSVVKLQDVLDAVTRPLINEMHLKGVGIYLREKSDKIFFACLEKQGQLAHVLPDSVNDDNPLVAFLVENKSMIESGEFRHKYGHLYTDDKILDPEKAEIQEALDVTFQAGLVLPIVLKQNLIGLMILGEKKSGDQFTHRDLALLETIASQMAITIENTKLYEQMLNNERLTVLGSMSASIAHEIRNPLAAIKTFVQMLPFKYEKPEFRRRFDEVIPSEIERLSRITEDLLNFARPSPPAMTPTDVNVLLERVTTLLANQMRKKAIIVENDLGEVPLILADSQQLTQVFMNLILNAVQASHDASRIFITTKLRILPPNAGGEQKVFISVRDEGVGIKKSDMASIFEPYFTTKHEGTGLGLATTKRIIDAHKGEIEVDSQEGQGATFTVILPFNPAPTLANRK